MKVNHQKQENLIMHDLMTLNGDVIDIMEIMCWFETGAGKCPN
jgi:hypothetical protein